jgi:hypothetical protein
MGCGSNCAVQKLWSVPQRFSVLNRGLRRISFLTMIDVRIIGSNMHLPWYHWMSCLRSDHTNREKWLRGRDRGKNYLGMMTVYLSVDHQPISRR